MKLLGAFVVGVVGGPLLIVALGYGFAFPGWALAIVGLLAAPFIGAILLGIWQAIPTAEQRAAAAADEEHRRFDAVRHGYRINGEIAAPDAWRPLFSHRKAGAAPAFDPDEPVPTGRPRSQPADLKPTPPPRSA